MTENMHEISPYPQPEPIGLEADPRDMTESEILAAMEPEDHSDDICPCGDPDCSRPFGHEEAV